MSNKCQYTEKVEEHSFMREFLVGDVSLFQDSGMLIEFGIYHLLHTNMSRKNITLIRPFE
jgi:hypothetical protein